MSIALPQPEVYDDWKSYAQALRQALENELNKPTVLQLPVALASSMPPAAQRGVLYYAHGATGPTPLVVSTSTAWKNVGDGSVL